MCCYSCTFASETNGAARASQSPLALCSCRCSSAWSMRRAATAPAGALGWTGMDLLAAVGQECQRLPAGCTRAAHHLSLLLFCPLSTHPCTSAPRVLPGKITVLLPRTLHSPGPVTAKPSSSMGRQILSTKSSTTAAGFGSSKRLADFASDVPGPGGWVGGWRQPPVGRAATRASVCSSLMQAVLSSPPLCSQCFHCSSLPALPSPPCYLQVPTTRNWGETQAGMCLDPPGIGRQPLPSC